MEKIFVVLLVAFLAYIDWLRIVGSPPSQHAVVINHMDCIMCHDLCCFEDLQYILDIKH